MGGREERMHRLAVVGLVAFFLVGALVPSGAVSLTDVPRAGSFGVAGDAGAELGLSVADCVEKNAVDPLVAVTNGLQSAVTVTVTLDDPAIGTLFAGNASGSSVSVDLPVGGSDTVFVEATVGGPYPRSFSFDVDGVGEGASVDAARDSMVDNNCRSSTPTPTATPAPTNEQPVADFTVARSNPAKVDVDGSPSSDPDGTIDSYDWDVGADGTVDATGQTAKLNADTGTPVTLVVTDDDGATNSTTKTAP